MSLPNVNGAEGTIDHNETLHERLVILMRSHMRLVLGSLLLVAAHASFAAGCVDRDSEYEAAGIDVQPNEISTHVQTLGCRFVVRPNEHPVRHDNNWLDNLGLA